MYLEFVIRILTKKCSMGLLQGRVFESYFCFFFSFFFKKNNNSWLLTGDKPSTRNALKSSLCLLMVEERLEWLSFEFG